jgi:hypothetical protein
VSPEFVVDHLVDLVLEEVGLLFVEDGLLVEGLPEGVFGHLEVLLDHRKRVLESVFQYFHLLLDQDQLLPGLRVCQSGRSDFLLNISLRQHTSTIRFFMGS